MSRRTTASRSSTRVDGEVNEIMDVGGPARGIVGISDIQDDPIYVSIATPDGPRVKTLVAKAGEDPRIDETVTLPGATAGRAFFDVATRMVHVEGTTPAEHGGLGGGGPPGVPTIYVIEPHANAVYADARLPFAPAAIVMDENQEYPSARPRSSSWRSMPAARSPPCRSGGTPTPGGRRASSPACSMALFLYVLARLLFRRRSVAVLLGADRARGRDAVRPEPDRDERFVRRSRDHRRLHDLRRAVAPTGGHAAPLAGVRARNPDHRPVPGVCAGREVGGRVRDRGPGPAGARPERPRATAADRRADPPDDRPGLHRDLGAGGRHRRQLPVLRDHDRAPPDRGDREHRPPDRLDVGRDSLRRRRARRRGPPRDPVRAVARGRGGAHRAWARVGHPDRAGDARDRARRRSSGARSWPPAGSDSGRSRRRPLRTTRPRSSSRPPSRRAAGFGSAPASGCRRSGWPSACS